MLVILVFLMGAQFYYPFGLQVVLYAAGWVPAATWLAHRRGWRIAMVVGVAVNAAVSLLIALPLVPLHTLSDTPIPRINQVAQDSIRWPRYVAQIAAVYARVPSAEQTVTIVYASNYGEAGAVDRYGGQYELKRIYSGQNALHFVAEPPNAATTVVFVGGQYDGPARSFGPARSRRTGTMGSTSTTKSRASRSPSVVIRSAAGATRGRSWRTWTEC